MPSATKTALTLMPPATPTSSPTTTSCQSLVHRRDSTIAAIANSATTASRWPPITSSTISSGLATQSRTARTGLAAVRSSTYPAATNAAPIMIISTQIVSHGLAPPISAAIRCIQVATGP